MKQLFIFSIVASLCVLGCKPKNTPDNSPAPVAVQEVEKKDSTKYLYVADWCTLPRGEFISGVGTIDSTGLKLGFGYELLPEMTGFYKGFNLDYIPKIAPLYFCSEIPQAYRKNKLKVIFSGYVKDMRLVDLRSSSIRVLPIEITEIRSADGK